MKKINIKNFKKTLSKFATGITVICVIKDEKIFGKTINSFSSLSLDPPLILFSISNKSSNFKTYFGSKFFSINILSNKQKNLSNHFSKNNPSSSKVDFIKGKNNISLINKCLANLECKLIDKIKKGDHTIFICKVLNVKYNDNLKPLYYYNSKYY
tara:strand:- start:422 stop:886 length:465 start_codon:yes stop_codon:yes gene_type:complete